MPIDFQKELNSEQLVVVLHGDGPCLVLAGAGSGKTRTITYRVAYLFEKGVKPENILLVTFTNKAAAEMVERMRKLTGSTDKMPWAGTFHHIGHKLLRIHSEVLGYQRNFSILDTGDSESLLKLAAKDFVISGGAKGKKFPSSGVMQSIISFSRNTEQTISDILETRYPNFAQWEEQLIMIAKEYEKKKMEANAMDFDDLLINILRLLNKPEILEKYSNQFQYVLVDEYQDTNQVQASIVKTFAKKHRNLLVVGDDAQSIYSFRGAQIENILKFESDFPDAKIMRLETNYRSSQEILSLANAVIANNPKQYKKSLKTIIKTGVKPELHPHADQSIEASFITEKILSLIKSGVAEPEIAVLFRASHHSQALELELMRAGIDYDYRGGLRFFERSHVKDVLAYLRLFNNLADSTAWMRVLIFEEGIGPGAAGKIVDYVKRIETEEDIYRTEGLLNDRAKTGWKSFLRIWDKMKALGKNHPAELVNIVASSHYKNYLEAEKVDSDSRLEDIKQLSIFAARYNNLEEFLADAALQEAFAMQNEKKKKEKEGQGKIVLSTIHQSKGLEWSAVFVINLTHGAFPNERALREDNGIEEERRLFYVAVTRAKKHLFLTYPCTTNHGGNSYGGWSENFVNEPSQFLTEAGPDLMDDHSYLQDSSVFNDLDAEITYEPEDKPLHIKPGSFLKSVEDL